MCILAGRPSLERLRHQCPSSRRNQRTNTMPDKLPMHLSPRCGESPKGPGLISQSSASIITARFRFTVTVYENKGGEVNHAED